MGTQGHGTLLSPPGRRHVAQPESPGGRGRFPCAPCVSHPRLLPAKRKEPEIGNSNPEVSPTPKRFVLSRRTALRLTAGASLLAAAAVPATTLAEETHPAKQPAPAPFPSSRVPVLGEFPGGHLGADRRFGGVLCSDLVLPHINQPENVTQLNVAWTREQFLWDTMSHYDPNLFFRMSTDQNYPTSIEVHGLLQWVAGYANGGQDKRIPPHGMDLPWYDSGNHWGWMAHHLAKSRLPAYEDPDGIPRAADGRNPVSKWIIGNEPDICNPAHPGYSWNSDPATYLSLLRNAWLAIKNASPDLDIIMASLGIVDDLCNVDGDLRTFWHSFLEAMDQDPAAADNQFYFNHIGLNLHKEPERIGEFIKAYREELDAAGMEDKELWLTEMGVPVSNDPIDPAQNFGLFASPIERVHFLVQGYANALAAGADRIAIYNMRSFLRDDISYPVLRLCMKYLKNTYSRQATKTPDLYGPSMQTSRRMVRIDIPGPDFITTIIYNLNPAPQILLADFHTVSENTVPGIYKVGMEGDEQQLQPGFQNFGFAGASAHLEAWGKKIYFIGGGTTMYRYPDGYRLITPTIV